MKTNFRYTLLSLSLLLFCFAAVGQNTEYFVKTSFEFGEGLNSGVELDQWSLNNEVNAVFKQANVIEVRRAFKLNHPDLMDIYVVVCGSSKFDLIEYSKTSLFLDYAELIPEYGHFYTPNDIHANQWNLNKVKATGAWDIERDASSITIAIVDDAVLITHPDLSANIWTNPLETLNGIDDDGNGYIDDINGYDVADSDNDPNPPSNATSSHFSHGTHCAGIASASTDNSTGIASLGFNAKLMAVKCKPSASSGGGLPAAYQGVDYAIAAEADIISMSWGGGSYSTTYQTLFNVAHSKGIVLVAAAGNSNVATAMYPAGYNHVISVAASDQNDKKASFSNYGTSIDVSAPGVSIWSTVPGSGQYDYKSGTSMACPMVSGLCALMLANSQGLSPDSLEKCLTETALNIDALNPSYAGKLGSGRIDAEAALNCTKGIVSADFSISKFELCPGQNTQFTSFTSAAPGLTFAWSFPGGSPSSSSLTNPTVTYNTAGTYSVTLTVSNSNGSNVELKKDIIIVAIPTASMSGNFTIEQGDDVYVPVTFTGTPPFSFTYTDGTTTTTKTGIPTKKYFLPLSPLDTTIYSITQFSDSKCSGTYSGSATVNVVPRDSSCDRDHYSLSLSRSERVIISRITMDNSENVYACGYGQTSSGTYYGIVIKVTKNGKLAWFREYRAVPFYSFITMAENNEDIVVIGLNNGDETVSRIDPSGNLVWTKTYSYSNERYYYGLVPSNNNTFIIGGMGTGQSGDDLYAVKIDGTNGNVIWNYAFHYGDDQFPFLTSNGDGGAFFCGNSPSKACFAEIDKDGALVQSYITNGSRNAQSVVMSNGYVFMSNYDNNSSPITLNMSKFDLSNPNSPSVVWSKKIGVTSRIWSDHVAVNDYTGNVYLNYFGHSDSKAKTAMFGPDGTLKEVVSADLMSAFRMAFKGNKAVMMGSRMVSGKYEIVLIKRVDTSGLDYCFLDEVNTTSSNSSSYSFTPLNLSRTARSFSATTLSPTPSAESLDVNCLCFQTSVTSSTDNICVGDSVQLEAGGGAKYRWLSANGLDSSDRYSSNPWVKPTVTTTYGVIISNCECPKDTMYITVNVENNQFLDLGQDTTICDDDTLELSAEPGYLQYTWTPNYNIIHDLNWRKKVFPRVDTTYVLTVQSQAGCDIKDSIHIKVKPCCEIDADFNIDDNLVCLGDSIRVTNTTQLKPGMAFNWNMPGGIPFQYTGHEPGGISYPTAGYYTITLIATAPCGADTIVKELSIIDFVIDAGPDTAICLNDTVQIGIPEISDYEYSWTPSFGLSNDKDANPIADVKSSTRFYLEVTNPITGCVAQDSLYVTIIEEPNTNLRDTTLCDGESLTVDLSNYNYDFVWNDGSTGKSYTTNVEGDVWYIASRRNCVYSDTLHVKIENCECLKFVPNVFTPNADLKNDRFKPIFNCSVQEYYLSIYNRWGEKIWETYDLDASWDGTYRGKNVPDGVYFWMLEYKNKSFVGNQREVISGSLTIIR
jgi:gliding motility-associated-like protein